MACSFSQNCPAQNTVLYYTGNNLSNKFAYSYPKPTSRVYLHLGKNSKKHTKRVYRRARPASLVTSMAMSQAQCYKNFLKNGNANELFNCIIGAGSDSLATSNAVVNSMGGWGRWRGGGQFSA